MAAQIVCKKVGYSPSGLKITLINNYPVASGLGSSCGAVLGGLVGVNELLGAPLTWSELLDLALGLESHAKGLLATRNGQLCIAARNSRDLVSRSITVAPLQVYVAAPAVQQLAWRTSETSFNRTEAVSMPALAAIFINSVTTGDLDL